MIRFEGPTNDDELKAWQDGMKIHYHNLINQLEQILKANEKKSVLKHAK